MQGKLEISEWDKPWHVWALVDQTINCFLTKMFCIFEYKIEHISFQNMKNAFYQKLEEKKSDQEGYKLNDSI